ncbi:kynureninase [Dactylosporangium aurantiacum]|uniref:Kynureninase n=1 Tax=Dactylosporangium aurantiacum TaxID=35754 RepID=A0A9Q9ID15_9ACTN|nr:kynureninase [Dactylosporangium aurantiacum]MDG6108219.1 kynureninase [Dactylosporangium aurantiacum]UWZ53792.1 kynureninase [Dactylosporangium aurantiacum]
MDLSRQYAEARDAQDPIGHFRARFHIPDGHLVYFDGNSLGRLPLATRDRLLDAIEREWGGDLIRGWDTWIDLAGRAGDVIAEGVLDVAPGEVILSDSSSVNLFKLASAALDANPGRRVIVTDDDNFPTDRYVLEGLAQARGLQLRVVPTDIDEGVDPARIAAALDDDVALVCLSHVAYRSGALADMVAITTAAHRVGALTLWDLCHSAGSVPVPLRQSGADLAVGCTYKYLNAGPGAPAFLFVRRDLQARLRQPIWGWFGQRDQFAMGAGYDPVESIERFQVGTPPVLGGYAVLEGARITAEAGVANLAAKSAELLRYTLRLNDAWLGDRLTLATPSDPARRGSHVTFHHPQAWQICQALKAAGVIPDFRTPQRLRIGLAPLYTRFVDVWEGMARLRDIVDSGSYEAFEPALGRVT